MPHTSHESAARMPASLFFSSNLSNAIEDERRRQASFETSTYREHDHDPLRGRMPKQTCSQVYKLDDVVPQALSHSEPLARFSHIAHAVSAPQNDDLWFPNEAPAFDDPWTYPKILPPQDGLVEQQAHQYKPSESRSYEDAGDSISQAHIGLIYDDDDALCDPTMNVHMTHDLLEPGLAFQSSSNSYEGPCNPFLVPDAEPIDKSRSSSISRNSFLSHGFPLPLGATHAFVEGAVEESEDVMFSMDAIVGNGSLCLAGARPNESEQMYESNHADDVTDSTFQRLEGDQFDDVCTDMLRPNHDDMLERYNLACQSEQNMSLLTSSYNNQVIHNVAVNPPGLSWESDRYEADVASSFPPTNHHFPPHLQLQSPPPTSDMSPITRRRGATVSSTRPIPCPPRRSKLTDRNRPEPTAFVRRSRGNSGSSVSNNVSMVRLGSHRGVRSKPLGEAKAQATHLKRVGRTVCSRCRSRRVDCDPVTTDPQKRCKACIERDEPCERADFASMSAMQTCNLTFQTSCTHFTLDAEGPITIPYSPLINLVELYSRVSSYRSAFNVGVYTICGAQWDLDLHRFTICLEQIRASESRGLVTLDDILLNRRLLLSDWHSCINGRLGDVFEDFFEYTKMPNRNAYYHVSRSQASRRMFDVKDAYERQIIETMTQACRIILRALETAAFRILQKDLNEINRSPKIISAEQRAIEIENTIYRLGRLLGTLRWRIAYWQSHTAGDTSTDVIDRVVKLTRILYFWFFIARGRLDSTRAQALPAGVENIYPYAVPIFDKFPEINSAEGFNDWLSKGQQLVHSADLVDQEAT